MIIYILMGFRMKKDAVLHTLIQSMEMVNIQYPTADGFPHESVLSGLVTIAYANIDRLHIFNRGMWSQVLSARIFSCATQTYLTLSLFVINHRINTLMGCITKMICKQLMVNMFLYNPLLTIYISM